MSTADDRQADIARVKNAILKELKVHVRVSDQGHAPSDAETRALLERLPDLSAFGNNKFKSVRAVLDWDHQIPSQFTLLRILACYEDEALARVNAVLDDRDEEINENNLYPEFDVPDYGDVEASETYVAVLRPGSFEVEDFRFLSNWRKQVPSSVAETAVAVLREHAGFKKAAAARQSDGLGGAVVIGWAPPCLANTERWALEVWLLIEFDGHMGKARVFMVDTHEQKVTREFETDVQLA